MKHFVTPSRATFALTELGALGEARLGPRVQHIRKLHALVTRPARGRRSHEPHHYVATAG
jgi:hypothetical protein